MLPTSAVLISTNDGCLRGMLMRLQGMAVVPVKHGIRASPSFRCTDIEHIILQEIKGKQSAVTNNGHRHHRLVFKRISQTNANLEKVKD